MSQKFAFIDVETTGLDIEQHELLEVGCVVARNGGASGEMSLEVVEEFESKIKPEHIERSDPEALRVNRYNETEWLFASEPKPALEQLVRVSKDAIMVAHNLSFDFAFLDRAFLRYEVESKLHRHKIDTLSIAHAKLFSKGEADKLSLSYLCKRFGITNERAHTALADARATMEVYEKLMNM